MAGFQSKVLPLLNASLAVFILFVIFNYLRMDFALVEGNEALERQYRAQTVTYKRQDGGLGRLQVLTLGSSVNPSKELPTAEEKEEDQEFEDSSISEELVAESIKRFLKDQMESNLLKDQDAWLKQIWQTGAGKHISVLQSSTQELLRQVLLELQKLERTFKAKQLGQEDDEEDDSLTQVSRYSALRNEDQAELGEFKFREYGRVCQLVVLSSYRSSLKEFTVVTLSPSVQPAAEGPVHDSCVWLPDGRAPVSQKFSSLDEMILSGRYPDREGIVDLRYVENSHGRIYDTLVVRCSFPEAVGIEREGGFLYLNMSASPGSKSFELIPVFHERPRQLKDSTYERTSFQYQYAYCSAPVWTNSSASHIKQWFMYHHTLTGGSIHYYIYDTTGIDDETMAVLKPLMDMGYLTFVNLHRQRLYDAWANTEDLIINDCLNRVRFVAKWALFWDFDEYLHVASPLSLSTLLAQAEERAAPWVSFGNMFYNRKYCAPESEGGDWAVERMVYRLESPVCGQKNISHVCPGEMGHRKWIANPRMVKVGSIYRAVDPQKNGIILDTDVARINHYRGIATKAPDSDEVDCSIIKDPTLVKENDTVDGWWFKDEEFSTFAGSLKTSAKSFDVFQAPRQDS